MMISAMRIWPSQRRLNSKTRDTAGSPGHDPLTKTPGAHKTRPPHFLGGVHKHDAHYSARREPRTRAQT